MPHTKESTKWFIRITAPWEHIETKVKKVQEWIDLSGYAIGYHIGTKTGKAHAHIALAMLKSLQQQSINKRLKDVFGVKGADYSSKVWDGSLKAISYLQHDPSGKVEFHRWELSEAEKAEVQTLATVYSSIVEDAKDKASTRIPDRVLEAIEASGSTWSPTQIARHIYEGVREKKWYSPGQLMSRYVEEILVRQKGGEEYIDYLTDRFMEKWR